jgi:hypothetical protein
MQSYTPDPHTSVPQSDATFQPVYAEPELSRQNLKVEPSVASTLRRRIHINLNQLQPFERVERQFQTCGVTFKNTIALIPSNPAYQSKSGQPVLMGTPKNGWMEATFERPVRLVAGMVTASRSTVMAIYDANNHPLARTKTLGANLANDLSDGLPNAELCLEGEDIHRVTFHAFDGQLTLSNFCFGL